jgi:hypothetical protein
MVTISYQGRLANNIIQYLAGHIFSEKHNLFLKSKPFSSEGNFGEFFNFSNSSGEKIGKGFFLIDDNNFLDFLERDNIPDYHYHFVGFFQTLDFLSKYEKKIKNIFKLNYDQTENSSVFVHYRIGDIIDDRRMLPLEYFIDCLNISKPTNGYISSENLEHKNCITLMDKFNLKPFYGSPMETINFAKNFKKIILSEGTFSWLIGFLSDESQIYCNERDYKWHGKINMETWNKVSWDYRKDSIYNSRFLSYYSPIKMY